MTEFVFNSIEEAIADIANGRMVIVVDDEDRENEGDLVMAAHFVTPESINFMIKHGKGLVCVPVTDAIIDRMALPQMARHNLDAYKTAFTVSIDGAPQHGVTTGISASERARSIQILINPACTPADIITPGHIFPLRAQTMGVLKRAGHTEAAVDLARLAELTPAGVICEIIKDDGEMARIPDLFPFARAHNLKIVTIQDLIRYRIQKESFISKVETVNLPTDYGDFKLTCYIDNLDQKEHVALVYGALDPAQPILVRVHSECLTGDVFSSHRCDCGPQLHAAMQLIANHGSGVLLYMRQEGRGIGLANKIRAYKLQEQGVDTVDANLQLGFAPDLRDYGIGAQILRDLGIREINLMTNNPRKIVGLEGYNIRLNERVPIEITADQHNARYLETKKTRMGHLLSKERIENNG